jgi:hypothetical protein
MVQASRNAAFTPFLFSSVVMLSPADCPFQSSCSMGLWNW